MTTITGLTLDEWLKLPETKPASEYARGEVLQKPMPNFPHYLLAGYFIDVLRAFVRRDNLGFVGPELRCVFGPQSGRRGYVSDVVFISRARISATDARRLVPFREPPDLAVEVLSPDQQIDWFTEKIEFYLQHGVRLIWVVDPLAETVTVHRPEAEQDTLRAGDTLTGGDVLPGFSVPVADIFSELQLAGAG